MSGNNKVNCVLC